MTILERALKPAVYNKYVAGGTSKAASNTINPTIAYLGTSQGKIRSSGGTSSLANQRALGALDARTSTAAPGSYNVNAALTAGQTPGHFTSSDAYSQAVKAASNLPQTDYWGADESTLFSQQLENALMLKQLGYSSEFSDGQWNITPYNNPYLGRYGEYGVSASNQYMYESDYLAAQAQQQNQLQPSYGYQGYNNQGYNNYGYYDNYSYQNGNGYQKRYSGRNKYYSNNGQRYKGYNNYWNRRQYNGRGDGYANRYNTRSSSSRTRSWY